ncbi:uroporphyrinogen-III synthase [Bradyrhizobium sp.]|uniref:uroporphyrinogen-III synthase n=1 Tax=Bradyrhizobium sp. TaxID=376 RepID=UPI003C559BDA
MAVLVTRPNPDGETTAARLRAGGYEVLLAPMLKFEPVALRDDPDADYDAVIVTSANALRAIAEQPLKRRAARLPLFAVGDHTASTAADAGFATVISAAGDAAALRDLVLTQLKRSRKKAARLLYLAGTDLSRDLAGELKAEGFDVVTQTTYRMAAMSGLPRDTREAFAANGIEAVLHYSGRSAQAFVEAARADGVEISALAIPQCCISATVASILRDAGANQVVVAASPDENALFGALERALRRRMA